MPSSPGRLFAKGVVVGVVLAATLFASPSAPACTIFVLTERDHVLFCNNEDGANPNTRIWFVPGVQGRLGCAYVSSDDGITQGGFNTAGLACDWVAPFNDAWTPDPALPGVHGSVTQRVLEECRTVDEAVLFLRRHNEPSVATGHILIADRTGASVIIGSQADGLTIERSHKSRGFGFGAATVADALRDSPAPTVANGLAILNACKQSGATPTQYATLYNLLTGDIVVSLRAEKTESVTLNLSAELAKGAHYYEIPKLRTQSRASPRPLLGSMERLLLSDLRPIADREPEQREHFERVIRAWIAGTMRSADYTPDFWRQVLPQEYRDDARQLGALRSLVLLKRWDEPDGRHYCYRADFANAVLAEHIAVDAKNRIALIRGEDWIVKSSFRWTSRPGG